MSRLSISAYVKGLDAQIAVAEAVLSEADTRLRNAQAVLAALRATRNLLPPDAGQRKRRAKKDGATIGSINRSTGEV